MKQRYKIKVTQNDILNGKPRSMQSCPIALGIRRVIKKAKIRVMDDGVQVNGLWFIIPPKCETFISNFDDGPFKECKPFTFSMRQDNG